MYLFWHLLTTIVCASECAACLPQLRARFIRLIMFFGLGVIHGVVPMFTPIGYFFPGATMPDINMAAFASFIGVVMFAIGFRVYENWRPSPNGLSDSLIDWLEQPHIQTALRRLFWAAMLLGTVSLFGDWYVRAGSITAMLRGGRFDFRFEGGYLATVLNHGQTLMYLPGFLGFFLARRYRAAGILFAVVLAFFLTFAMQGTRGVVIGLLGGPILAYVICNPISPRRLATMGAAGFVLATIVVGLYEARKTMSEDTIIETTLRLVTPETYQKALTRDPLNTHQFFVAAVEHFPDEHPYLHGATYRRIPLFALPGRWFPGVKPEDTHMTFGRVISGRTTSLVTMMPTMFGDGWINFWGLPGTILIMFINGIVVAFVSQKVLVSPLWFGFLGHRLFGLAVLGVRGQPYDIFFVIMASLAIVGIVGYLCGVRWQPPGARQSADLGSPELSMEY